MAGTPVCDGIYSLYYIFNSWIMKFLRFLSRFKNVKKKLGHAWKAFLHPKTPFIAKLLLSIGILGYVLMPMDALPDFILFF